MHASPEFLNEGGSNVEGSSVVSTCIGPRKPLRTLSIILERSDRETKLGFLIPAPSTHSTRCPCRASSSAIWCLLVGLSMPACHAFAMITKSTIESCRTDSQALVRHPRNPSDQRDGLVAIAEARKGVRTLSMVLSNIVEEATRILMRFGIACGQTQELGLIVTVKNVKTRWS